MDNTRHQLNSSSSEQIENQNNLRDKIHLTRDEIGRTMNTIQDRLSPNRMAQYIKSAATDGIQSVKNQARVTAELGPSSDAERILNKSIPAALIGVGLAWIMARAINASQNSNRRTGNFYSLDPHDEWPLYAPEEESGRTCSKQANEQDSIKAQRAAIHASLEQERKEGPQKTNHHQKHLLGEWTSEPHERKREDPAKGEFQRFLQDNPLTMGVITLAIGTAVGLSLPRTRGEVEWMGRTRDHLVDQVKAASKDIVPKARRAFSDMERTTRKISKDEICGEKVGKP
jgi:hypothetical protein